MKLKIFLISTVICSSVVYTIEAAWWINWQWQLNTLGSLVSSFTKLNEVGVKTTSLINNYLVHHHKRGKENPSLECLKAKSSSKSNAHLGTGCELSPHAKRKFTARLLAALQTVLTCCWAQPVLVCFCQSFLHAQTHTALWNKILVQCLHWKIWKKYSITKLLVL